MVYNNNVPLGNQTIASTTDPIRGNFAHLQSAIGQEHNFDPADPAKTYHLQAAMPNLGAPVLPALTDGMYYVSGGESRFIDGSGNINQLTGSVVADPGYQWIGRVLIQWGRVSSPGLSGSVTFPIAFASAPFNIQLTLRRSDAPNAYLNAVVSSLTVPTATTFNYFINTSGNSLYWMAIGRGVL